MNRFGWLVLALAVAVGISLSNSGAQEKRATPVKWEYKILTQTELDKAQGLGQVGEEGWELVAVEAETREALRVADQKFGGTVTNTRVRERSFYFKRPK